MEYKLSEEYLKHLIENAYMAGFGQGTARNIGTTNALEKSKEYTLFIFDKYLKDNIIKE